MDWLRKILLWLIILAAFAGLGWLSTQTGSGTMQTTMVPSGFLLQLEDTGVQLFRKDYQNGTPDYVQVVDLTLGATVQLLYGKVAETRPGKGSYGGNDARFLSKSLKDYWKDLVRQSDQAFCVTNGQFFYMPESPTRLSLPLKVNGEFITDGYAINEHVGNKLMLEIWPERADIRVLDGISLYSSTAPNILGGLTVEANKRARQRTGRTFVGVDDRDRNGMFETVLIFNTRTALQTDAEAVLKDFGAEKVIMLDGGGSTQLFCQGKSILYSERLIPQALGVFAGNSEVISQAGIDQNVLSQPSAVDESSVNSGDKVTDGELLFDDLDLGEGPVDEPIYDLGNTYQADEDFLLPLMIPLIIFVLSLILFFFVVRYRQAVQEYPFEENE